MNPKKPSHEPEAIRLDLAGPALALCILSALALAPRPGQAVPAAPDPHTFAQPNGDTIKAKQWGDENAHGWEDEAGYSIDFDARTRRWNYQVKDRAGKLVDSGIPVRGTPRGAGPDFRLPATPPAGLPAGHSRHLRPDHRDEFIRHEADAQGPAFAAGGGRQSTVQGTTTTLSAGITTANIPVVLVNFSNTATTNTPAQFNTLLFGTGATDYSMKQFYEQASYGQFTVAPGTSGVVGWYKAPQTHDYYGTNNRNLGNIDSHPGLLVYQAVQAADPTVNFAEYDLNGDCYADTVMVVHQGKGEESGAGATNIWSMSWDLASARYYDPAIPASTYLTNDTCLANPAAKVRIRKFTLQPERYGSGISTMGVFAHEYGHTLGLPDLYDTDYSSNGIGKWSIMAYGSWNGVSRAGDRPSHFDAWSKFRLGWTQPFQVVGSWPGQTLDPAHAAGDVFQVVRSGAPTEYFLVENRQRSGFDAALPGSGLLIWRIDDAVAGNTKECYPGGPACASQHYRVDLLQADNLWNLEKKQNQGDAGDPFPGSGGKTAFNGSTLPDSNWYSGSASGFSVGGITVNADTSITADFSAP